MLYSVEDIIAYKVCKFCMYGFFPAYHKYTVFLSTNTPYFWRQIHCILGDKYTTSFPGCSDAPKKRAWVRGQRKTFSYRSKFALDVNEFIHTSNLSTVLQVSLTFKAYYLQIKVGFAKIFSRIVQIRKGRRPERAGEGRKIPTFKLTSECCPMCSRHIPCKKRKLSQ